LCGKIDWLEYDEASNSVNIIDFKTGKRREKDDSLQLPIYYLLARNCQKREVKKIGYWYLETDNQPADVNLPDYDAVYAQVLKIGRKIKLARQVQKFSCPQDGCRACLSYERVIKGECEQVGISDFGAEVYVCPRKEQSERPESVVL